MDYFDPVKPTFVCCVHGWVCVCVSVPTEVLAVSCTSSVVNIQQAQQQPPQQHLHQHLSHTHTHTQVWVTICLTQCVRLWVCVLSFSYFCCWPPLFVSCIWMHHHHHPSRCVVAAAVTLVRVKPNQEEVGEWQEMERGTNTLLFRLVFFHLCGLIGSWDAAGLNTAHVGRYRLASEPQGTIVVWAICCSWIL